MGNKSSHSNVHYEDTLKTTPWLSFKRVMSWGKVFYVIVGHSPSMETISEDIDYRKAESKWEYLLDNYHEGQLLNDEVRWKAIKYLDQMELAARREMAPLNLIGMDRSCIYKV